MYVAPTAVGPGTYEDTDANVVFSGSWTSFADPGNSGGSARYSGQTGAGGALAYSGSAITVRFLKQSNTGIATVTIDNVVVDQLDTYSATRLFQQQKTYASAAGTHTANVAVSGNKNSASSGPFIIVDAFVVPITPPALGPGTYDAPDVHDALRSCWTSFADPGNSGGSARYSGQT